MNFRASYCIIFVLSAFLTACGSSSSSSSAPAAKESTPAPANGPIASPPPSAAAAAVATAPGAPPATILFKTTYGDVTYTHQKHFERVNNDCATCHPSVFKQALEPLNYGKAHHRVAEEYMTSCAHCHNVNGGAFAAERNCQKCHAMGGQ